ncbi:Olfactory receptor 867 [Sciurus carolinensis]|uniref:Olfactory receptor 867 n=1 Tax=Sciurus carolinensis TaxID=30640 RepID=A0AA41SXR8_SCICA|nr:Olfactory receptor 867 [Sciurus carolinensis]
MGAENHTAISQFLLLGLSKDPDLQPILCGLFLSMYLVTVLGNLLILLAVSSDSHLRTPMYFFLSNMSFVDICITSTTIPKMLVNIHSQSNGISYTECLSQVNFYCVPMTGILFSYSQVVSTLVRMSSIERKYKAFSTCGSHLCMVSLFYGTELGVYLSSSVTHSSQSSSISSVMYTVVTPMLIPSSTA